MPSRRRSRASRLDFRSGAKPPSSPTFVSSPRPWSTFFRAWKVSTPGPEALPEAREADRHDHEFLEVHRVVGVLAAVDHVHEGHRQNPGVHPRRGSGRAACRGPRPPPGAARERDAEDGVAAEPGLVLGAVEVDHEPVEPDLVGRVQPHHFRGNELEHVRHGLFHTLAQEALAAVTELQRLVGAGGRPRGHHGPAARPALEHDLGLQGWVPAGVQHLPGEHVDDRHRNSSIAKLPPATINRRAAGVGKPAERQGRRPSPLHHRGWPQTRIGLTMAR
jgi:hypothetical protein